MKLAASTPEKHDEFGPSKHPMLVQCPAFHQSFSENEHTRRGTFMHHLVNNLYNGHITEEQVFEDDVSEYYEGDFTGEDREQVVKAYYQLIDAIDWFKVQIESENVFVLDETWLPLENLGISGGTPDMVIVGDFMHVLCTDYKFGQTFVPPETEQLMSLQTKLAKQYPQGRLFNCIIQPKLHDEPLVREIDRRRVEQHEEQMKWVLQAAKSGSAPRIPNRYCDWCDRFWTCSVAQSAIATSRVPELNLESMDNTQLGDLAAKAVSLKDFAGMLEKEVVRRLLDGQKVRLTDGREYYMSEGQNRRQWISEEVAGSVLQQCVFVKNENLRKGQKRADVKDLWKTELVGISEAEKIVGKSEKVRKLFRTAVFTKKTSGALKLSKKMLEGPQN